MGTPNEYEAALADLSRLHPISSLPGKVRNASDATYNYVGLSKPGAATSEAAWLILRIHKTTGDIDLAGSTNNYNQVWDSYAGLSYG